MATGAHKEDASGPTNSSYSCKEENEEMETLQPNQKDRRAKLELSTEEETAANESNEPTDVVDDKKPQTRNPLLYSVEESPPWYQCIMFGMQHYLMMVEGVVAIPFLLAPLMCMQDSNPARGHLASTIIFVSGLVTLLQSSFGIRLPIVQGGSVSFLAPTIAILTLRPCPSAGDIDALTPDEQEELWQVRMREVQGAICVASCLQVVVGLTGAIEVLLRFLTPLAMMPTIALIGLSLVSVAAEMAAKQWGISLLTMFLLLLFSQYLGEVKVPFPVYSKQAGFHVTRVKLFKLFPVLLAVSLSWGLCGILTYTESLDKSSPARTDSTAKMVGKAPWFYFPYPLQWGTPTVALAGVVGLLIGVFTSVIESIGDYYACARLAGAPPPPAHALNRGITCEGIGCILAGIWGTGNGTTSYSQNVGAIGITRVGSLRVIQYLGILLMVCGLIGKLGGFFMTIPEPIIGGIFCTVFPMIVAVGVSTLHYVDLTSTRNLFVIGIPLFFGLMIPTWFKKEESISTINTGSLLADQIILVLLRTPMFIGSFLGILLDNTMAGTDEERGIVRWRSQHNKDTKNPLLATCDETCYDLPFGMPLIRRWSIAKGIPISPTFTGWGRKADSTFSSTREDNITENTI